VHQYEILLTWKFPNCVEPISVVAQGAYELAGDSGFELLQLNVVVDTIMAKVGKSLGERLVGVCPQTRMRCNVDGGSFSVLLFPAVFSCAPHRTTAGTRKVEGVA